MPAGNRSRRRPLALAVAMVLAGSFPAPPAVAQDWTAFGGGPGGGQFTPLKEITPDNVKQLVPAWTYHSGEMPRGAKGLQINLYETTPLHANGALYACTRLGRIVALDPATGKEKWAFDPHKGGLNTDEPRASICRGAAYWEAATPEAGAGCQKRVIRAHTTESGGRLYAVDADTGAVCKDFAAGTSHPGYVAFSDFQWGGETKDYVWVSSAPMIYRDLVIVANSGLDNIRANSADGYVRAFDVRTGEQRWAFTAIPPDMSEVTGGAEVWAPFSVDVERGLVIVPTTSPSPDHYGGQRLKDIPLANALVALKADTGEVAWSQQTVHHDVFDYDIPAQPIVTTVEKDGTPRPAVIGITKTGLVWTFDRDTGAPIGEIKERPVPASDVPGEQLSPTQPVPSWPEPFSRQTITKDDIYGLTPFDKAWCRNRFEESRYEGMFTPPSLKGSIVMPGYLGGGNWGAAAFDAERQVLVVKAMNIATMMRIVPRKDGEIQSSGSVLHGNKLPMAGTPYSLEMGPFQSPLQIPCTKPPWSTLTAIDMRSGKILWQHPLGQVHKYGVTIPAFFGWGGPSAGGPLMTASGLIFIGASTDRRFRAFDVKTGEEVWRADLPHPGMAVPLSYGVNGRQFVAIAAGSYGFSPSEGDDVIVAFALPNARSGTGK